MAELIHVSRVRIVKDKGSVRRAYIEGFPDPVRYGVHGGIKKFYGVSPRRSCRRRSTMSWPRWPAE